jgi:hypothetical protein
LAASASVDTVIASLQGDKSWSGRSLDHTCHTL